MTLKPSELNRLLQSTIKARKNVLITGAPGIGKSDIVAQACNAAGADLHIWHPAVSDPTDVKGMPWIVNDSARFIPFGDLRKALDATKLTVIFLDDLGQATAAVQAGLMQLLLARRVNDHVLPDCVTFVAATNRRADRAGVSGILEPVKSRFKTIVELTPDLNEWCAWAINAGVRPEVIAFLRFRPDLLSAFVASADMTNSPMPRTWASASDMLALFDNDPAILHVALAGAVGESAAVEFAAFLRLYQTLPSVDAVLVNPDTAAIPTEPATLYALSSALAHRATDQNFSRVARFVERMVQANHGEFGVLLYRDAIKRHPKLAETTASVKLMTGDFGRLLNG